MTLDEAKAALAALEKPGHDVANTRNALQRAQVFGDVDLIATAQTAYDAALEAKTMSTVTSRDIDIAAQVVLDLQAETE